MKNLVIPTIASTIAMFGISLVWHFIATPILYPPNSVPSGEPNVLYVILGYIVFTALMVYLYPKFVGKNKSLLEGFRFGAFMGVLWNVPLVLIFMGVMNYPALAAFLDSFWGIIEQGIGGIVIALLYWRKFA